MPRAEGGLKPDAGDRAGDQRLQTIVKGAEQFSGSTGGDESAPAFIFGAKSFSPRPSN